MRDFLGWLSIIFGICLGLYISVWQCLVLSIVTIIDYIKGINIDSLALALAIVKISFCTLSFWIIFFVFQQIAILFWEKE